MRGIAAADERARRAQDGFDLPLYGTAGTGNKSPTGPIAQRSEQRTHNPPSQDPRVRLQIVADNEQQPI